MSELKLDGIALERKRFVYNRVYSLLACTRHRDIYIYARDTVNELYLSVVHGVQMERQTGHTIPNDTYTYNDASNIAHTKHRKYT